MAHARLIRYTYFNDPKICGLTINERYFLIGLLCTANDWGKLWLDMGNIRSTVFPTDDITLKEIQTMVDKIIQTGILCIYEVDGIKWAHFPNWRNKGSIIFQWLNKPRPDAEIPDCPFCESGVEGDNISKKPLGKIQEDSYLIEKNRKEKNLKEKKYYKETNYSLNDLKNNINVQRIFLNVLPPNIELQKFEILVNKFDSYSKEHKNIDAENCGDEFIRWYYYESGQYKGNLN